MLHKPKILIIDEQEGSLPLINQIINAENEYQLFRESGKIKAGNILFKEKPDMILLCTDSKPCIQTAESLLKRRECPRFVLMGKGLEDGKPTVSDFKRFKALDAFKLPFEMDEFSKRIEDASFIAEGMIDELTGLYKKPCFDFKLNKLMRKKVDGIFFCISLNAYSFAANPSLPLQIQMAVYALKISVDENTLLGISGNIIVGFIPTNMNEKEAEKMLNEIIEKMVEAADKPVIYIPAGACTSMQYNYSPEDMLIYADKAMAYSGSEGKNKIKFYK